ncbi:MAG: efflux RND transporter periplasmic adaptor subunit [Chloroflexi bacterium]|nr:efflux RND transporter periplasmic adaptor subunit [Chloroflexota bacterium]
MTTSEQNTAPGQGPNTSFQTGATRSTAIKLGLFVVLATVIAIGAYFGVPTFLLDNNDANNQRRPVAVERGTLLDDVTASGSVTFPHLESLRFDISGTVAEILVDEGDSVTTGQTLIVLDDVTISALESAVAQAEIDLQEAGVELAALLRGATALERAIAASALADARVDVKAAAAQMAEFTSADGTESAATREAKDALTSANDALARAVSAADDVAAAQAELISGAREVSDDATADYESQLSGWFGNVVSAEDRKRSPDELFSKWQVSVDSIFSDSSALTKSPLDDLATPWNELVVWVWTHLTPYPILTSCDETSKAYTFRCPSAEINESWDLKIDAEESLNEAIEDAADAASAQQNLIDASRDDVAEAVDAVVESTDAIEIGVLVAAFDEAFEREREAEANVAELDDLDLLQIKLATAGVNQAKAGLDKAVRELAGTQISAPFDGVVTSISVDIGDPVNRTTQTIDIIDPSIVQVDATVDEIDVLLLKLGDRVSVALDALPDRTLVGTVAEIGEGVNQQGVIQFPLSIDLEPPDGIELIEGLSATATIVINQIDDALLIPLQSVGGSFNQATVDVVDGNSFVTTPVTLGASDGFWVVVESGLSEGQQVLMTVAETVDPFQQLFGAGGTAIRIPGGFGAAGGRGGGQAGGGR